MSLNIESCSIKYFGTSLKRKFKHKLERYEDKFYDCKTMHLSKDSLHSVLSIETKTPITMKSSHHSRKQNRFGCIEKHT